MDWMYHFFKDVSNFVKDVSNFIKDVSNCIKNVPRLPKSVLKWGMTSNNFPRVSKRRNEPWKGR